MEGRQPKNKTLPLDGIKSSIIDEMFFHNAENIDGGAIQYITPFKVKKLIELQMLEEIK